MSKLKILLITFKLLISQSILIALEIPEKEHIQHEEISFPKPLKITSNWFFIYAKDQANRFNNTLSIEEKANILIEHYNTGIKFKIKYGISMDIGQEFEVAALAKTILLMYKVPETTKIKLEEIVNDINEPDKIIDYLETVILPSGMISKSKFIQEKIDSIVLSDQFLESIREQFKQANINEKAQIIIQLLEIGPENFLKYNLKWYELNPIISIFKDIISKILKIYGLNTEHGIQTRKIEKEIISKS